MAIIAKGNQRGSGRQLAAHLLNARDNERVEPGEMRGTAAADLPGAFAEWELQAKATRCSQTFYHLSVSPDHSQAEWTEADYYAFLDRAEERLGLQGQPRAVVFHVKEGRHHCHCVWSRIDVELGRAVHLSNDRMKLRSLVQEVALERGLELPDGLKHDKGAERTGGQHTRQAEQKQQERSGQTKAERTAILTAAWQEHPEARAFVEAIGRAGFTLARGDGQQRKAGKQSQPVYVVIDGAGEVHSLARQIEGVKSKEIFTRLNDGYALDQLETVEATRAKLAQEQGRAVGKELRSEPPTIDRDRQEAAWQDSVDKAGIAYVEERRRELHQTQATERESYERHEQEMTARHSATWGEAIHRHAVEMAEAHSVAPASYQPGTVAEAEQAATGAFSFFLSLFTSIAESAASLTSSARRRSDPDRPKKKPNKRDTERREQEKRDQHQQEINAITEAQAHERESYERRKAIMLQDQQRAREHFEQNYADPSAMRQAFDTYAAELGRVAARKEARQERERSGPEREGPELGG